MLAQERFVTVILATTHFLTVAVELKPLHIKYLLNVD